MTPIDFRPVQSFDGNRHRVDPVAKLYLEKINDCPNDLLPVMVMADRNCLYNSMILLMGDPTIGVAELRGLLSI